MKTQLQAAKYYGTGEASAECKLHRGGGDTLTIKNHSAFTAEYGLTNTPAVLPVSRQKIEAHTDVKVVITKDNTDNFGHWLVIHNPNELDDVNVTILVAKGKG